jgi:hypothetical protein
MISYDEMARSFYFLDQIRILLHLGANHKKSRTNIVFLEGVQDEFCLTRLGPIIKCQYDVLCRGRRGNV